MLKEAIETIQQLAIETQRVTTLQVAGMPHKTLLISAAGNSTWLDHPPDERSHFVEDFESLLAFATDNSAIWHNGGQVYLSIDDRVRRESVNMPLTHSVAYEAICDAGRPRTQKEFIAFLRGNLQTEITAASPGFIDSIRSLKFRKTNQDDGDVQHGRESMGKEIEYRVTGADTIADEMTLECSIFDQVDYVVPIRCFVDIDFETFKLSLVGAPSDVREAMSGTQRHIHELLKGTATCPVYRGTP